MRHFVTVADIEAALRRRRSAEQFLGGSGGQIRWLELRPEEGKLGLFLHVVEDVGYEGFYDIYAFPYAEGGDEDASIRQFDSVAEAIEFCSAEFGAAADLWVNQGIAQDDYASYVHANRPHPWRPVA